MLRDVYVIYHKHQALTYTRMLRVVYGETSFQIINNYSISDQTRVSDITVTIEAIFLHSGCGQMF
jgi:hypothetical protein